MHRCLDLQEPAALARLEDTEVSSGEAKGPPAWCTEDRGSLWTGGVGGVVSGWPDGLAAVHLGSDVDSWWWTVSGPQAGSLWPTDYLSVNTEPEKRLPLGPQSTQLLFSKKGRANLINTNAIMISKTSIFLKLKKKINDVGNKRVKKKVGCQTCPFTVWAIKEAVRHPP